MLRPIFLALPYETTLKNIKTHKNTRNPPTILRTRLSLSFEVARILASLESGE